MEFLQLFLVVLAVAGYQATTTEETEGTCAEAGVDYPDYQAIPDTNFTCVGKPYIPGFYADMETGCQVFHVCTENFFRSLLCPVQTVFNQSMLACDKWTRGDCARSPEFYSVNEEFTSPPAFSVDADGNNIFETKPEFMLAIKQYVLQAVISVVERTGHLL